MGKKTITEDQKQRVIEMYLAGREEKDNPARHTYEDISLASGCSVHSVYRIVNIFLFGEEYLKKERIDRTEIRKSWLKHRGFKLTTDYVRDVARRNSKKPENKDLGKFIAKRLEDIGKDAEWLATELNLKKFTISRYIDEKLFPSDKTRKKMYQVIGRPEDYNNRENINNGNISSNNGGLEYKFEDNISLSC